MSDPFRKYYGTGYGPGYHDFTARTRRRFDKGAGYGSGIDNLNYSTLGDGRGYSCHNAYASGDGSSFYENMSIFAFDSRGTGIGYG